MKESQGDGQRSWPCPPLGRQSLHCDILLCLSNGSVSCNILLEKILGVNDGDGQDYLQRTCPRGKEDQKPQQDIICKVKLLNSPFIQIPDELTIIE